MNLRGTRSREDPEINFIPLIDVLLVILIFLMVTTTYQRVAELQITLPEADAEQPKQGRRRSTSASIARAAMSSTGRRSRSRRPARWPMRSSRRQVTRRSRS
jgi:biopolymer transport protein ExbD